MGRFYFLVVVFCVTTSVTVFSQPTTRQAIQTILEDHEVDPLERYKCAAQAIHRSDLSTEDALELYETVMMAFAEKQIKESDDRNHALVNTYDCIRTYNNRLGNKEGVLAAIDAAVPYLEQCQDLHAKARFYRGFGNDHISWGSRELAFDYLNRSIEASEQIEGHEQMINVCYYIMAIPFQEVHDHRALADIITKMQVVAARAEDEIASHQLYSVQMAYYDSRIDADSTDRSLVDSALLYAKEAIRIHEKHGDKIYRVTMPVWSYYNIAVMYNSYFDPPVVDSIARYLTKAEAFNTTDDVEVNVAIKDLKAWSYLYRGEYGKAEAMMREVLAIIDAQDRHTLLVDRCEAYRFMVKLYKQRGDLRKAMEYQELYTEVYKERFDSDNTQTLRDLTIKYDVERKESEIAFLKEHNAYVVRLTVFGFATAVLLFLALVLGVFVVRLRKRNLEQQIYEAAMEAEMSRQELESLKDGVKPSRALVGKLGESIQSSPISMESKASYLERLSTLDFDAIEAQYLAAKSKLSAMDMRYIICFFIDMSVPDISTLFNVEPASVHTVRYRIKKKFGKADSWSF